MRSISSDDLTQQILPSYFILSVSRLFSIHVCHSIILFNVSSLLLHEENACNYLKLEKHVQNIYCKWHQPLLFRWLNKTNETLYTCIYVWYKNIMHGFSMNVFYHVRDLKNWQSTKNLRENFNNYFFDSLINFDLVEKKNLARQLKSIFRLRFVEWKVF